jgi:anti-sigma regulatory factor (Ser/Thr protein kinase)
MTMSTPEPWRKDPLSPAQTFPLSSGLRSPGAARTLLREALTGCSEERIATAQLLVSELVTNAVLHARPPFVLGIQLEGDQMRIVVTDGSSAHPLARPVHDDTAGGRGLPLVEALASTWGWYIAGLGKSVWFEL